MRLLNGSPTGTPPCDSPVADVAIIGGTGALGHGLARRWGRAGVTVHIGSREAAAARVAAAGVPGSRGGSYQDVIAPIAVDCARCSLAPSRRLNEHRNSCRRVCTWSRPSTL